MTDLMRAFLFLVILVMSLPPALASGRTFTSAKELQVTCTSSWGNRAYYEMYAACRAYVIGVADTLAEMKPARVCPPEDADRGLITERVMRALGARLVSEEREALVTPAPGPRPKVKVTGSAAQFVRGVLMREFPCP